jgi:hypothetical protein
LSVPKIAIDAGGVLTSAPQQQHPPRTMIAANDDPHQKEDTIRRNDDLTHPAALPWTDQLATMTSLCCDLDDFVPPTLFVGSPQQFYGLTMMNDAEAKLSICD